MLRRSIVFACVLSGGVICNAASFDYQVAQAHEIKPHRRIIPMAGIRPNQDIQIHLKLTVSPLGDVVGAEAKGDTPGMALWPQVQNEIRQWKFVPFEEGRKAVKAEVEEYVDLVQPERLPTKHIAHPELRPDSQVAITLERSQCYGRCPNYKVTVSADRVLFEGQLFVVAVGAYTDVVVPDKVRMLAKRFLTADFYSMEDSYQAQVTDMSAYTLSLTIDGHSKKIIDYVGASVGMPAVIKDLEDEVDALAGTNRWIDGDEGLVQVLRDNHFNFQSPAATAILKEATRRGKSVTVRQLLEAGVPPLLPTVPSANPRPAK